jgi:hypothetical protein
MTASALKKLLSELSRDRGLEYLIKRHDGNLMTVRFYVEGDKQ